MGPGLVWKVSGSQRKVLEPAVHGWMGTEEDGHSVRLRPGLSLPLHFTGGAVGPCPQVAQAAGGFKGPLQVEHEVSVEEGHFHSPRSFCCQLKLETV